MADYTITADYSKDAGKLGRHNLSFKTGAFKNKRHDKKLARRREKAALRKSSW